MSNVVEYGNVLADVSKLEEVLDREALNEVCRSFYDVFGISIRVISQSGLLLADVHEQREICGYVNTLEKGRVACGNIVGQVKQLGATNPGDQIVHACFTGAVYRIVPIAYQGRAVGRFVIGPYLPAETREVPNSLLVLDERLDHEEARRTLAEMPRVRLETAEKIARHLQHVIDVILFAGHRAHLTSEMHIASVRESYRELAEKNAKLQDAYDKLKELDRLKSNFLATVSHELRTPLTSIIGYSEMLVSGLAGELSEEQKEFAGTIHAKGEHLLALISSLLDLSKLDQGKLTLTRERQRAEPLLTDVIKNFAPQAQKKEVKVLSEVEPNLEMHVDPLRMRQVLFNLTDNALKFTPPGGEIRIVARRVELEDGDGGSPLGFAILAVPKRGIEIAVSDTGIGIREHEQQRVFDAFYQVDGSSTREHGGIGLGLSIVKRLVEAHGGTVQVESTYGRGTTFSVRIPDPIAGDAS